MSQDETTLRDGLGFSLADIWRALVRYRWSALMAGAVPVALCVAIAMFSTRIYRAEVQMIAVVEQPIGGRLSSLARQFGDLASLAGVGDVPVSDTRQEAMALLPARGFTVDFIKERNLMPVLFPETWSPELAAAAGEDVPTFGDGFRVFDDRVRDLHEDSDKGIVTLGIEWKDPVLAADWANGLVAQLNARMRDRAIAESERSIKYLEGELGRATVIGVQQVISRSIETHVNRIALAKARSEYAFKIVDPAVAPEADEYVRPRKLLLLVFGLVMGSVLAVAVAILRMMLARTRDSAVET